MIDEDITKMFPPKTDFQSWKSGFIAAVLNQCVLEGECRG